MGKSVVTVVRNKVYNAIADFFMFPIPILLEKTDEHRVYQWLWWGVLVQPAGGGEQ